MLSINENFYDSIEMSEEEINEIPRYDAGIKILEERNLTADYVEDLNDIKEILMLKYHLNKNRNSNEDSDSDQLYEKYTTNIKDIDLLVNEIKKFVKKADCIIVMKDIYSISSDKIKTQLDNLDSLIAKKSFPILTAGEAKAGKSTFINMLLGRDLLPMKPTTCTSIIWEIQNSINKRVTFYNKDQTSEQMEITDDNISMLKELTEKQQLNDKNCDRAVIEYPVNFLNNTAVLVDSPGIGDNEEMESIAFDYLHKKTSAFIFVLNSINTDGLNLQVMNLIAKSREQIQSNMELLVTNNDEEETLKQQLDKAIFILNHWDVVKKNASSEEEVEEVKQKIITEIQDVWPESARENENIFFISSLQAKEWSKNGIEKMEIIKIKKSLKRLVTQLYKTNLENIFHIMNDILSKLESLVLNMINANVDCKYNLSFDQRKAEELCNVLEKLIETINSRKRKTFHELVNKLNKMIKDFTAYLKSPDVERSILESLKKQNVINQNDNVDMMTKVLKKCLIEEIKKEFKTWNEQNSEIERLNSFLERSFENHLNEIGREITIPNDLINKDSLLSSWDEHSGKLNRNGDSKMFSKMEKIILLSAISVLFPVVAVAGLFAAPLMINHMTEEAKEAKYQSKVFQENPSQYMTAFVTQILTDLTEEDVKRGFFTSIYKRCEERVIKFEEFIQTEIQQKRKTIQTINLQKNIYPNMLTALNRFLNNLEDQYGKFLKLVHSCFPDLSLVISLDNFVVEDCTEPTVSEIIAYGQYSTLFVSKDQTKHNVVFKTYTKSFDLKFARYQWQEIQFLNKPFDFTLKCRNVCYINKPDGTKLCGVFEKCFDSNLLNYLQKYPELIVINHERSSENWRRVLKFVLDVGIQLSTVLSHLHLQQPIRMVHPDLNLETILVKKLDKPEIVKILIYDVCTNLPTMRSFKLSGSMMQSETPQQCFDIGGYTKANIFALGVVLYRMTYFKDEEKRLSNVDLDQMDGVVRESIEVVENFTINWQDEIHNELPEEFNNFIKKCISKLPHDRPNISVCMKELKAMASNYN